MARAQVLVQFDEELLSLLDQRAATEGVSRSELLRRFARTMLADSLEAFLDQAIADGYQRLPAEQPDAVVTALAVASIEQEPW